MIIHTTILSIIIIGIITINTIAITTISIHTSDTSSITIIITIVNMFIIIIIRISRRRSTGRAHACRAVRRAPMCARSCPHSGSKQPKTSPRLCRYVNCLWFPSGWQRRCVVSRVIYMYIYMCICTYVYVYVHVYISLSLSLYIYIYTCVYMYLCVYVYMYICITLAKTSPPASRTQRHPRLSQLLLIIIVIMITPGLHNKIPA